MKDCSTIDISKDGEWIAFGGRYKAYLWNVNNDDMDDVPESQLKVHSFTEKVTVLKFNPERPVVSIGDRAGRITQITNYHLEDEHIVKSILHWHHLPVRCLSYMADGSYLLSGGEETVLVIWQLDTGHKQFLPHLGEKIAFISISPNHRFYCISLDDNSIRFVNTISQNVEQVIQGLQYGKLYIALLY